MKNPESLEQEAQDSTRRGAIPEDVDALRAQRQEHDTGWSAWIDSLAEGVIERPVHISHETNERWRIAELDTKIASQAADEDRRAHVRSAMSRLTELSSHLQSHLEKKPDWTTKREIIRAVVQRIEIGTTKVVVVLRLPTETSARVLEPIVVTCLECEHAETMFP